MPDIQENLRWNTDLLYPCRSLEAVEKDLATSLSAVKCFRDKYFTKISTLNALELKAALSELEDIHQAIVKPQMYAHLLFAADSRDPANQKLSQKGLEVANTASQELLFFELELIDLPEQAFLYLVDSEKLATYRHFLESLRKYKPHTLAEREERLLKQKSITGAEAFHRLFDELTASFSFRMTLDGEEQELTGEELLGLLHHPDASVREQAFSIFLKRFADEKITFSAIINNIALDHSQDLELRAYQSPMEPTHLANELTSDSVECLMETTENNYHLAREYFTLKARLLKLAKLKNTDVYAPVGESDKRYSFAQARDIVLDAFGEFNPEFREIIGRFFIDERIDAFPRPGKSGGAFCMGISPSLPPYVLLNFTGNLRDVATLAHELGHGLHFTLAQKQTLLNYHPPLPLAETASVFAEMLLTRFLLDREKDPAVRISLLCAKIEDIIATTFRQNVLTRFDERLHLARKESLVSSSEICDIWWEENGKLYGDAVEMIEPYRWGWSYIPHFIHSRFYCYSYTFAELLVLALFQNYLNTGKSFVPVFTSILESGGSLSPADTVRAAGIDLAESSFWQKGYDLLEELMKDLWKLL